jgi:hypothetical protein
MTQTKLVTGLTCAIIVPEKNDLHVRPEGLPTAESVALKDGVLIPERLSRGKERKHLTYSTSRG